MYPLYAAMRGTFKVSEHSTASAHNVHNQTFLHLYLRESQ